MSSTAFPAQGHPSGPRIGTVLPNVGHGAAAAIRERLPFGFESFQLAFKNTLGGTQLEKLADETVDALGQLGRGDLVSGYLRKHAGQRCASADAADYCGK